MNNKRKVVSREDPYKRGRTPLVRLLEVGKSLVVVLISGAFLGLRVTSQDGQTVAHPAMTISKGRLCDESF